MDIDSQYLITDTVSVLLRHVAFQQLGQSLMFTV